MATNYTYILTKSSLAKNTKKGATNCPRCKQGFKIDQKVISRSSKVSGIQIYHKSCFEELYI